MATNGIVAQYEELREIDYTSISDSIFTIVGTPTQNPVRIIELVNDTDVGMYISDDGIRTIKYMPPSSAQIVDYGSDKSNNVNSLDLPSFSKIYVMAASAPTSGIFTVAVCYARGI